MIQSYTPVKMYELTAGERVQPCSRAVIQTLTTAVWLPWKGGPVTATGVTHLARVAEPQINHSDKEEDEKMALSCDDFRHILTGQENKIATGVMVGGGGGWSGSGGGGRRSKGE